MQIPWDTIQRPIPSIQANAIHAQILSIRRHDMDTTEQKTERMAAAIWDAIHNTGAENNIPVVVGSLAYVLGPLAKATEQPQQFVDAVVQRAREMPED